MSTIQTAAGMSGGSMTGPATQHASAMLHAMASAPARMIGAVKAYWSFRSARARLMNLDDRMLKDIGIDRSEITSVLISEDRIRSARDAATWASV